MRLYPFHGIRYARPGAGRLAAPPYDQIDDRLRDRLHGQPYQFAHLSRPIADGDPNPYDHAAHLHGAWLDEGILHEEAEPALYPYEIQLPSGARRLGVTTMLGLESETSGVIRPHEQTLAKAVADRLELLRAMRVDLEPILVLADDGGAIDRLLQDDVNATEPLVEHEDAAGNRHRLSRLTEPARIRQYVEAADEVTGLIADGHHRYKVAGLYAREIDAFPGSSAAAKLTVLTSLASPELTIDPIHRGLATMPDLRSIQVETTGRQAWEGDDGREFAAAVAAAPQPALGVWPANAMPEIWTFDAHEPLFDLAPARRRLAVILLHRGIFPALGLEQAADTDGTVVYRSDPQDLVEALHETRLAVGIFLPPMEPEAFAEAVSDGGLLPPKSTRFLPKVVSGLVWARHATALG
jgi:uncharacterized protein (DUF1015 family)